MGNFKHRVSIKLLGNSNVILLCTVILQKVKRKVIKSVPTYQSHQDQCVIKTIKRDIIK